LFLGLGIWDSSTAALDYVRHGNALTIKNGPTKRGDGEKGEELEVEKGGGYDGVLLDTPENS